MTAVGIIGIGSIAKQYINAIEQIPQLTLMGVFDSNCDAALSAKLPKRVVTFNSSVELINNSDMVIICSPTSSHYGYLKEALEAKVPNVLCEKPVCSTPEQAESLKALSEASSTSISVSYNLRFLTLVEKVIEVISHERVCTIDLSLVYERGSGFKAGWRESASICKLGGAAGDLGSHLLDLTSYISNSTVSINKKSAVFGFDLIKDVDLASDGYFEAMGELGDGGGFKITASKMGSSLLPGFTLHLSTPTKTLYYTSKNPKVLVLDNRDGQRHSISLNCNVAGAEDLVMAGWTDSFKKMLQAAVEGGAKVADLKSSIKIVSEIYSVF